MKIIRIITPGKYVNLLGMKRVKTPINVRVNNEFEEKNLINQLNQLQIGYKYLDSNQEISSVVVLSNDIKVKKAEEPKKEIKKKLDNNKKQIDVKNVSKKEKSKKETIEIKKEESKKETNLKYIDKDTKKETSKKEENKKSKKEENKKEIDIKSPLKEEDINLKNQNFEKVDKIKNEFKEEVNIESSFEKENFEDNDKI